MIISVVIPSFYPAVVYGGTIFSSLNTAKELVRLGHEVRVSTTNTNMHGRLDVAANQWVPLDGLQVKYYNETIVDKLSLRLILNVWKDMRKADVVHIQAIFNTPVPVSLLYARLMRKPVLLSPRGVMGDWILNQGNRFKREWLRWLIKPFAQYVTWHATAEQEAEEILSRFPKARIEIIPNGIHTKPFQKSPWLSRAEYLKTVTGKNFPGTSKVIVSMGRLHKKKGLDLLIAAFEEVLKQEPETVLLIAGPDEGELQNLHHQTLQLGLEQRVCFTGALDEQQKVSFLLHADVFALPSHNENFGNVYAEALAAGIPVVTSVHTPWLDLEEHGCGKAVPLDTAVISAALIHWLKADKTRAASAARRYIEQYSWETIGKRFQKVFQTLTDQPL